MKNLKVRVNELKKTFENIANKYGTPVFIYDEKILKKQINEALSFPNAFGLSVRYAMKANSNLAILKLINNQGLEIDASSGYEAERAIISGISPNKILLTSQELPHNLKELISRGVEFTASSLHQLEVYGKLFPGKEISVRINPGLGSGGTIKTSTGGPDSSFGIYYKDIKDILKIKNKYFLKIKRIHTHIGSGSDPEVWKEVAKISLKYVKKFIDKGEDISILNLGGGYKIARMPYEKSTSMKKIGLPIKKEFINFYNETQKKLKLEIEPGTFLLANSGYLLAKIIDIKKTPMYNFIIVNSGMTENLRPSLYGAQHPIFVLSKSKQTDDFVVAGHCCESGDILTPAYEKSELLKKRKLIIPKIGDLVVVGGVGAYCSSMSAKNYNSYPEAPEVLVSENLSKKSFNFKLIRKRQTLAQLIQNEIY